MNWSSGLSVAVVLGLVVSQDSSNLAESLTYHPAPPGGQRTLRRGADCFAEKLEEDYHELKE
jgi:hypothetical protein